MTKYIIIVSAVVIAAIVFLLYTGRRDNSGKVDPKKDVDNSFKKSSNKKENPAANIEQLDMEVNNGGFNQYFFNSSGQNCFETLRELKRQGKYKKAQLLEKAIGFINPNKLPETTLIERLRTRQVDELDDDSVNVKLDSLDQIYFKAVEE